MIKLKFSLHVLLTLLSLSLLLHAPFVCAQYANGRLIWIDYRILNQANSVSFSELNGSLSGEVLDYGTGRAVLGSEVAGVNIFGGGSYSVAKPVQIQASIWTGQSNRSINSVYVLLHSSVDGSNRPLQTIQVYNVPGAVRFTLTATYTFNAPGSYIVMVRFNGMLANAENSTRLQIVN